MIQRFRDRYQLWREEKNAEYLDNNPLSSLAVIALVLIALNIYQALSSHNLGWSAAVSLALLIAFAILYLRKSRWAWLIIPIIGASCLVQAPLVYMSSPPRVRLFSLCFGIGLGVGAIWYGFVIRRRYYSYIEMGREYCAADSPNI